jgi:uncharacterized protein (TIGR00297 family)
LSILARPGLALVIALAISLLARRVRSLSVSGAVMATVIGTLALVAGWRWAVLLVIYFVSASALSRIGARKKEQRTASVVAKSGERDALQVLANGGVFGVAAALVIVLPDHPLRWLTLGVGALGASASDTWATEIGTLRGGTPRSILGFERVPVGMSGGVTLVGTIAAVLGAACIAVAAFALFGSSRVATGAFLGGVLGSSVDSLLGATLQQRRWCDHCKRLTERLVHDCGTDTRAVGGLARLNNDAVNVISGLVGGLVALALTG